MISERKRSRTIWILPALIVTGLVAGWLLPVGPADLLAAGEQIATRPVFVALVVIGMAVLFTFGLPGSFALWLIAPFHPPLIAVPLLLAGSLAGAFGAYRFARSLGSDWRPGGAGDRVVELLNKQSDFLTQCALRILPGFPHSVINFAGGVLKLKLGWFLAACAVGLSIKWGVYAWAVYDVVEMIEDGEALSAHALLPLLVLTILLLAGAWARRRV